MVEYIFNTIRATAGEEITISADITDNSGEAITENCSFLLFDDEEVLYTALGFLDEYWSFTIPAEVTEGKNGRYWYCINHGDVSLCFKEPIYLL